MTDRPGPRHRLAAAADRPRTYRVTIKRKDGWTSTMRVPAGEPVFDLKAQLTLPNPVLVRAEDVKVTPQFTLWRTKTERFGTQPCGTLESSLTSAVKLRDVFTGDSFYVYPHDLEEVADPTVALCNNCRQRHPHWPIDKGWPACDPHQPHMFNTSTGSEGRCDLRGCGGGPDALVHTWFEQKAELDRQRSEMSWRLNPEAMGR